MAIECTEMMVLWCLIEKVVFKFGFEKGVSLTKFHFIQSVQWRFLERDYSIFIKNHHPLSVNKRIKEQKCVCLVNPTLALSRTMGAFVL